MLQNSFVKIIAGVAFFASLFLSNGVKAQTVDRDKFQKFIASAVHQNLVKSAVATIPTEVFPRCPDLKGPPGKISLTTSMDFSSDGVPNSGGWWERLPVSGCGNDTILNIWFEVAPGGAKINSTIALPGTTHASVVLQRDALNYATMGFGLKVKACKQILIKNTRFESYGSKESPVFNPDAPAKYRPWWETWTAVGCGQILDIPMAFIPDETGTRILAKVTPPFDK